MKKGHKASMTQAKKKRRAGRLIARLGIAAIALGATVGIAACGSSGSSLNLVAYSTPQQVYEQSLEPGFKDTSDGKDVDFSNSFGASGDQSRAVESGQPADVVEFSLEPDMTRLVDAEVRRDHVAPERDGLLPVRRGLVVVRDVSRERLGDQRGEEEDEEEESERVVPDEPAHGSSDGSDR